MQRMTGFAVCDPKPIDFYFDCGMIELRDAFHERRSRSDRVHEKVAKRIANVRFTEYLRNGKGRKECEEKQI